MEKMNITGDNLRALRIASGLSQQQFVSELAAHGVSMLVCTLCKIEHCHRRVNDIELKAFADVLNISVSGLYPNQTDA